MKELPIRTEYIRLSDALKLSGAVSTGGHAKIVIAAGEVKAGGEICTQRGKKLYPGDGFAYAGTSFRVVKPPPPE